MKTAVRALVLGMLLTGFAANHMLASKSATAGKTTVMVSSSAMPMPSCEPGQSGCGSGGW
ncbi:MAG TPA: hypothetical protein VFN53_06010 [Acidobacteriaceae bacterium]|nr:hypothetical protein [Acidobacteriaceae bacterium]